MVRAVGWVHARAPFVLVQSPNCVSTLSGHRCDGRRDFGQRRDRASAPAPCRRAPRCRRSGRSPPSWASARPPSPRAYQELRQRGLVETAGRHGTRVRPRPPVAARRAALRPPAAARRPRPVPAASPTPGCCPRSARTWPRSPPTSARRSATPTPACCPSWPRRPATGCAADGVPAEELTVTGGALDGIERLLGAHLRPGDAVAVEDPGWANLLDLVAALGLRPIGVPVDDEGPTGRPGCAPRSPPGRGRWSSPAGRRTRPAPRSPPPGPTRCGRCSPAAPDLLLIEDDHAAELARVPAAPAGRGDRELGVRPFGEQAVRARTCGWRCWPATRRPWPG